MYSTVDTSLYILGFIKKREKKLNNQTEDPDAEYINITYDRFKGLSSLYLAVVDTQSLFD